ncbi:AMP-binding protein [Variovorax sp. W6]|uniref:AMP-binding protein n=1 Tax=Variovorax sp. W6 TaxID=3093895 RepID=UPI003D803057
MNARQPSLTALLRDGMRTGAATLWVDAEGSMRREEFAALVVAQVALLRRHGMKPGDRVALHGTASRGLVAMLVGCLLEGVVVVPIDAALPRARKQAMLDASTPALAIDFAKQAPLEATGVACIPGELSPQPGWTLDDLILPETAPDAGCYIFFTSGTTGSPKGILGRRGGLAHFLAWEAGMLGLQPGDRVGVLTRLSFDVVLRDLLLPVVARVTGCLPPEDSPMTPAGMPGWLATMAVSVLHAVPSLAQACLAGLPAGARNDTLRHTLFAGEPLGSALVERWRAAFPASEVYNLYGPTETTLAKFCARVPTPAPEGIQCCGLPLPEVNVSIVDEALRPLGAGCLGEVAIRTVHRSLGYLDPAEPSATRFVVLDAEPAYLSGDLGFLDDNGALHLRGRKDHQVKILGTRIEPAGVAAVMQSHESVTDAAVLCVTSEEGGAQQLVGYFSTQADAQAVRRSLRPFLAERLPAAAVPSHLVALDALPLTPNGKLDRARLPAPPLRADVDPADADELALGVAAAIARVLRQAHVGVDDDFFALGGDSLAAMLLCAELEAQLGVHAQPLLLMHAPTARELAQHLRTADAAAPAPIPPTPRTRWFALSPQQWRYFRTFCAGGNRNWCNMVALFELPDGVDTYAVERALTEIALRHDSLCLRFDLDEEGVVRQSIVPTADIVVPHLDLGALDATALAHRIDALRVAEGEAEIPLFADAPLFRATLLALPGERRRLLWTVHHLVSDGTSQGLLARELAARLSGLPWATPAPPSMRDIAAWAHASAAAAQDAHAHFRALLGPPYRHRYLPNKLPCDDPQRCHAIEAALPGPLRDAVGAAARRLKCTPYVLFVAAYFRWLSALTGSDDLVVVTPLAGRAHPQIAQAIGDFINLVPLRVSRLGTLPARQLIENVRDGIALAARSQECQFDQMLDELGLPFDADRNPLTGFSLNFMPQGTGDAPALATVRHADRGYRLKYDLLMLIRGWHDATHIEIQYRAGLLTRAGIEVCFTDYCAHLQELSHA